MKLEWRVLMTRPELVPEVVYYDSARHTLVLRELLEDFVAGNHLLLIGSQGVGEIQP